MPLRKMIWETQCYCHPWEVPRAIAAQVFVFFMLSFTLISSYGLTLAIMVSPTEFMRVVHNRLCK